MGIRQRLVSVLTNQPPRSSAGERRGLTRSWIRVVPGHSPLHEPVEFFGRCLTDRAKQRTIETTQATQRTRKGCAGCRYGFFMAAIGYMIRVELKKHPGTAPDESNSYLVLPPPGSGLPNSEVPEKAFDILADAIHSTSTNFQHPVIEETSRRRVSIGDLRPYGIRSFLRKTAGGASRWAVKLHDQREAGEVSFRV